MVSRSNLEASTATTATVSILLLLAATLVAANQDDLLTSLRSSSMILPLFLQTPKSSPQLLPAFHRQLKLLERRHPNARMRLYDDLLLNGYYTTRLLIGTPPQEFALIVDSGSTVTYVPCSTCEQCGKHQDPKFQPDLSSTYKPVECNIDCTCNIEQTQCTYDRNYAEMSSSSGVLSEDIVSFGNGSALQPQRAVFGCENEETGDLYSQHADGIMGLGRGQLSILDQLVDKGAIDDSFSLCYGGMDVGGGAMVLGGISPPNGMIFSHSDPVRSPYYNIELKEIHVAGKPLKLNPRIFDGKHGTILDSGTTYAYLPEAAFHAFRDAITENLNHLKQIRGPDPNYNDICFSGAGSNVSELSKTFPEVDMVFDGGNRIALAPENYLFRHSRIHGAYCLGIFQNGKDPSTLLGGIVVRNTLVTYDRENEKIGFFKTNCSVLWDNVNILGANLTNNMNNSITGVAPTMAPSDYSPTVNTGNSKIATIMIVMSLSIEYSDLKPHLNELGNAIAARLKISPSEVKVFLQKILCDVDIYKDFLYSFMARTIKRILIMLDLLCQVHLLNFTESGNKTNVTLSIQPSESTSYFSYTTAMEIINRFSGHQFQLPASFGNYSLVDWKVEPPLERSWWNQHKTIVLGCIFGVVAVLAIGFALFGIWYVRKQRQQALGTYRPVVAVGPEQELQKMSSQDDTSIPIV